MEVRIPSITVVSPPEWVQDKDRSQCSKCEMEFSFTHRRHHCRACGEIFCSECCGFWFQLPNDFHVSNPERACLKCFKKWSSVDYLSPYDVYGPEDSPLLVILIHDACRTRKQFLLQVNPLSEVKIKFFFVLNRKIKHKNSFIELLQLIYLVMVLKWKKLYL